MNPPTPLRHNKPPPPVSRHRPKFAQLSLFNVRIDPRIERDKGARSQHTPVFTALNRWMPNQICGMVESYLPTRVAVVGSRQFKDRKLMDATLLAWQQATSTRGHRSIDSMVTGDAKGADKMAIRYADKRDIDILVLEPDFKRYGAGYSAPLMCNSAIVKKCTHLVAFPTRESRGTWDAIRKARAARIPVTIAPLPSKKEKAAAGVHSSISPHNIGKRFFSLGE